jgi:hypothetical protein
MKLHRLITRVAIVVAAVAALAALVVASAARADASRTAPGAPRCASSGLVVWLDTQGSGTAGSFYYRLELTNLSGHACRLSGYPGVSAVDLLGRQLGRAASRNTTLVKPTTVRLANGRSAAAVLRVVDTGVFAAASCRPVTAAGLRVYPPNETRAKIVPFPFSVCTHGPTSLSVAAVQKA